MTTSIKAKFYKSDGHSNKRTMTNVKVIAHIILGNLVKGLM